MWDDKAKALRRALVAKVNVGLEREEVEKRYGKVWDTAELQEEFEVQGFIAPFVSVIRKSDAKQGTLMFQDSPRFYFLLETP